MPVKRWRDPGVLYRSWCVCISTVVNAVYALLYLVLAHISLMHVFFHVPSLLTGPSSLRWSEWVFSPYYSFAWLPLPMATKVSGLRPSACPLWVMWIIVIVWLSEMCSKPFVVSVLDLSCSFDLLKKVHVLGSHSLSVFDVGLHVGNFSNIDTEIWFREIWWTYDHYRRLWALFWTIQ